MSETSSEGTNPESFELINDVLNNMKNEKIILSTATSSVSTDFNGEIIENDEYIMEMPIESNLSTTASSNDLNTINLPQIASADLPINVVTQSELQKNKNVPLIKNPIDQGVSRNNETQTNPVSSTPSLSSEALSSATSIPSKQVNLTISKIESPSLGFLNWLSKNEFLNKVAEKASNSFDSVITTLDPGMKEILYSGGDINILVVSGFDLDINRVRDAFLDIFKRATIKTFESQQPQVAIQLVGIENAEKSANERISSLRENISIVAQNQVIVSVENFLYCLNNQTKWFASDYIFLDDPLNKIRLEMHTQCIPIEKKYLDLLNNQTPEEYQHRNSGFSVRIEQLISENLSLKQECFYQQYAGIDRNDLIYSAVRVLAHLYRNKLKSMDRLKQNE